MRTIAVSDWKFYAKIRKNEQKTENACACFQAQLSSSNYTSPIHCCHIWFQIFRPYVFHKSNATDTVLHHFRQQLVLFCLVHQCSIPRKSLVPLRKRKLLFPVHGDRGMIICCLLIPFRSLQAYLIKIPIIPTSGMTSRNWILVKSWRTR